MRLLGRLFLVLSRAFPVFFVSIFIYLPSCADYSPQIVEAYSDYIWRLPAHFPKPNQISDNRLTLPKIELGRHLFYDKRLSENQTFSCASCHLQKWAFTDRKKTSVGSTGDVLARNSMSISNMTFTPTFTWANPALTRLRQQALIPIFGEDPVELGLSGKHELLIERIRKERVYLKLLNDVRETQSDPELELGTVTKSLEAFQRTIISGGSPYDRFLNGDRGALSESTQRGLNSFFSEKMECFHCHGGFNLSDNINFHGRIEASTSFHNTGLYNIGTENSYPESDQGLKDLTFLDRDNGRFKTPTLRNIFLTPPYMHDGSINCDSHLQNNLSLCADNALRKVIKHYAGGGRNCTNISCSERNSANPRKSGFVSGFNASPQEVDDTIEFFKSLTDCGYVTNPNFSNPWPVGHFNNDDDSVRALGEDHPCKSFKNK